jgi:hypothetical protein
MIAFIAGMARTALPLFIIAMALVSASGQSNVLSRVAVQAYGELYYGYDFSNPEDHERPYFVYNHKRHNEVNANLLLVRATYADSSVRANIGLMAGTYAQYNLAAEPEWARFIYEASIGIRLSRRHDLWMDAGIMPSHLGFESAIGADNWTLTRSLTAEESPYYETGIKVTHISRNQKWTTALLLLNGWQRIQRPDGINAPSFGFQLSVKTNETLTLNYSNFIGTDKPDDQQTLRTFHNLYAIWEPGERLGLIAGFDIGTESAEDQSTSMWYTPVAILRYALSPRWSSTFRAEYYRDDDEIIVPAEGFSGFSTLGLSANLDYRIRENLMVRLEGKTYQAGDPVFSDGKAENYAVTAALTLKL